MPQTAAVFPSAFISLSLRPFLLVPGARPVIFLAVVTLHFIAGSFSKPRWRHANAVIVGL